MTHYGSAHSALIAVGVTVAHVVLGEEMRGKDGWAITGRSTDRRT